ncbi:MAG: RES domain-containing protein [Bacteroidetes bacterium]|nr:RES domain-containing protein [Bacteroidota bacterium]
MNNPKHHITIPNAEQIAKGFEAIKKIDWASRLAALGSEAFYVEFDKFFRTNVGFSIQVIQPNVTIPSQINVFRVRQAEGNMDTTLISTFSHPPPFNCKIGRANLPTYPVFYASPMAHIAIMEAMATLPIEKQIGSRFFLSQWSFRENISLNISFFVFDNVDKENIFSHYGDTIFQKFKAQFIHHYGVEGANNACQVLLGMSDLFVEGKEYNVSAAIAHSHIYAPHNLRSDIFIYPSIASGKCNVNFALHPNTVLEKLQLKQIYFFEVTNLPEYQPATKEYTLSTSLLQLGVNKNGIINWCSPNEKLFKQYKSLFENIY